MKNEHLEAIILFLKQLRVDSRLTSREALWLQKAEEALETCRVEH